MMRPSPYLFPRLTPLFRHAPAYPPVIVHTTSAVTPTHTASETDQATGSWWVTHIHQNTLPTLVRILNDLSSYLTCLCADQLQ